MTKTLKIPGKAEESATKSAELAEGEVSLDIQVQQVISVTRTRAAGEAVTAVIEPLTEGAGQLAEVELEDGIKLWMRVSSLYRDFGAPRTRGATPAPTDDVWEIAPQLTRPATTRGESKETRIRQVTLFRWQREAAPPPPEPGPTPEAEATEKSAEGGSRGIGGAVLDAASDKAPTTVVDRFAGTVGRQVECNRLGGNEPGLYWQPLDAGLDQFQEKNGFDGDGPFLLFIHGTMSSFKGSFSELWSAGAAEARQQLARQYSSAYAWEHYTLTESPIKNALALAEKLPDQAKLHLVSHSRGGLVGDLLCLGQRETGEEPLSTARILDLFRMAAGVSDLPGDDNPYNQQAANLGKLIELLENKKIQVERFVRVACPARGTTLASNRLDRWLSVFKLLGDLALPAKFPLKLLLALIAEHDDPRTLPGLEAMMPGSPLVRLLNFPDLKARADLSVIAGDTAAGGLLGRLKEFVLERFFEDESDIVVNTGAMYGGLRRADGGRFYLDRGPAVNHFSYFKNATTIPMLTAGLLRADNANAGFQPLSSAEQKDPARAARLRRAPQGPRPVVFLLPGILGSHLKVDGDRIWLAIKNLMLGRFGRLAVDAQRVAPDALFEDYYGRLVEYLEGTHEVIRFPYDWRLSILEAGEILAKQVTAKLNEQEQKKTGQPVRILAHSMGGLVVRAMLAQKREVWQRMTTHPDARLLMLGTPNSGSYEIVNLLVGRAQTLQQLALLDLTRRASGLLKIINRFPGILELLPTDNDLGCFQESYWQNLRQSDEDQAHFPWPVPSGADLQQAQRTWRLLQTAGQVDNNRTLYVAGSAPATLIGWRVETDFAYNPEPRSWKTLVFEATRRGDGRVPWDTGIPPGVKTWYLAEVGHGDLPAYEAAFPAYLELLQAGATSRLPMTPSVGARAATVEQRFDLLPIPPATLPDESELAAGVLGATRRRKDRKVPLLKVSLTITHGDLSYARYPVAVGHYRGDTIVSAEDYLDRALQGRLRKRHRLDLYPGRLGTCEVFLNPDKYDRPGGAIVIGLGQVGELSPGSLEAGFAQAALSYALQVFECPDDRFGESEGVTRSARISTLLIGTGAGGMTVRDAIGSILRGVAHANRRLDELRLSDSVWIDHLEFLELWQDMAIQAAAALEQVLDGELEDLFIWEDRVVREGQGGLRRLQFEEPPDWWHRLEIGYDSQKDELRFIALTDRARAEETLVAGQRRLADGFIREAIADTGYHRDTSRTLFEMLLPNGLKQMAPNRYNVVLLVDEVSGGYPWELLEDRWGGDGAKPFAVAAGVLRQLKTPSFRERPTTLLRDTVYVIGNPQLPSPRKDFPFMELQGAEQEARAVAEFLQQRGFQVTRQIHGSARAILAGLHADSYRVLHLAGHGVHDWEVEEQEAQTTLCTACAQPVPKRKKQISGMLIGDNLFLTPGEVEQMRWIPELVFINCCHLGSLQTDGGQTPGRRYDQLAANIAAQFICMGVKAVVAAGWAVDDAAAKTFAISFYTHLLAGDNFGDAVRAAREETFDKHSSTNTWGAYQCYGDPAYRLRPHASSDTGEKPHRYVLPSQLAADLENLAGRVRTSGGGSVEEVETLVQNLPPEQSAWLQRPEVAAALGLAYGELGEFDKAIKHLNQALAANKADFPIQVVEQRANFKSSWAVEIQRSGDQKKAHDLLQEAIADLKILKQWGATVERSSLLGGAYKRLAWIASDEDARKDALQAMADCYRQAHELAYDKGHGKLNTYPLLNWLVAEILLVWQGKPSPKLDVEIEEWCRKAEAQTEERERSDPSFWNAVVRPECELLRALARKSLEKEKQAIIKAYRQARQRGASPRQFRSVLEHLEFLKAMAAAAGQSQIIQTQAEALRDIVDQLSALII